MSRRMSKLVIKITILIGLAILVPYEFYYIWLTKTTSDVLYLCGWWFILGVPIEACVLYKAWETFLDILRLIIRKRMRKRRNYIQ